MRSGPAADAAFRRSELLEQQDLLATHRIPVRSGPACAIKFAEYEILLPLTTSSFCRLLPEVLEDAENELTAQGRQLIASLREEVCDLDERFSPTND